MAGSRKTYKATVSVRERGRLTAPDFRQAQRRAMRIFAPLLEREVRAVASRRVKNSPSLTNMGRRRYPDRMADRYTANLIEGDRAISLTANTQRGRIFETGAKAHPISSRSGGFLYFRHPKPRGPLKSRRLVHHPGQAANPVMGDTLRVMAPVGRRILDAEIRRAL